MNDPCPTGKGALSDDERRHMPLPQWLAMHKHDAAHTGAHRLIGIYARPLDEIVADGLLAQAAAVA